MIEPNKTLAYDGCKTSCGAVLIAGGQDIVVIAEDAEPGQFVSVEINENAKKSEEEKITISFEPHANPNDITEYSLQVLREVLKKSGIDHVTISSTARGPYSQARVMYEMIEAPWWVSWWRAVCKWAL